MKTKATKTKPRIWLTLRGPSQIKTFTAVDHAKFMKDLLDRLTPCQAAKAETLYMGMREFLDQNLCYRRKVFWRIGKALSLPYCVRQLVEIVEKSEAFDCIYNEKQELIAFSSPYVTSTDRQMRCKFPTH